MALRTATEVAKRALVMGAVAFRASLEVTDDPRASEFAERLPHWLDKLQVSDAIDPLEREILHTPFGQLEKSQRIDANWSGEGAALFGWTLGICEKPPQFQLADQASALTNLKVMRSGADIILETPL